MPTLMISAGTADISGNSGSFIVNETTIKVGHFTSSYKAWVPFIVPVKAKIVSATLRVVWMRGGRQSNPPAGLGDFERKNVDHCLQ
jgi:hypothetical protein